MVQKTISTFHNYTATLMSYTLIKFYKHSFSSLGYGKLPGNKMDGFI